MNTPQTALFSPALNVLWKDYEGTEEGTHRPVLIVAPYLDPDSKEKELLLNMMTTGCKLNPDQFHLLMLMPGECVAWHKLKEKLNVKVVFAVGISLAQLGITAYIPIHKVTRFNGALWLYTYPPTDVVNSQELKKVIWDRLLKPVFKDMQYADLWNNEACCL